MHVLHSDIRTPTATPTMCGGAHRLGAERAQRTGEAAAHRHWRDARLRSALARLLRRGAELRAARLSSARAAVRFRGSLTRRALREWRRRAAERRERHAAWGGAVLHARRRAEV